MLELNMTSSISGTRERAWSQMAVHEKLCLQSFQVDLISLRNSGVLKQKVETASTYTTMLFGQNSAKRLHR